MTRPHAADDVRARALAARDAGQSVVDVTTFFQNDPSTIRRWIRQRPCTGSSHARPRSGRPPRIQPDQLAALRAQVAAHADATLATQCDHWRVVTGVRVSLATMGRVRRDLGITRKKDIDRAGAE